METRSLGKSHLTVQPVILGAWAIGGWFWGGTDDDAAVDAIRASLDAGISGIDTAPVYGCGHSETVVGRAIAGRRDEVCLMTKVGLRWDDDRGAKFFDAEGADGQTLPIYRNLRADSIKTEVEASLKRMNVDHIDLVQCHWPDPTTPVEETMKALASLVNEGVVGAIGVSNFDESLLARAERALDGLPLSSNQPKYSLLNRKIEEDILPWCRLHQVGVIAYSPMERGLLTGKVTMEREFADSDGRSWDPMFTAENRRLVLNALAKAQEIADSHGCTLAQLAAAWVFHQPGVTAAIVGARTPQQARENAKAADVQLSESDTTMLGSLFGEVQLSRS